MNIIQDLTQVNYTKGRQAVIYLVSHFTGNYNDTARGNANYFRSVDRGASAGWFVDDIDAVQVVKDEDTSWHCGDGFGVNGITNANSIGIEMCATNGTISDKTMNNAVELIKMLKEKYNVSDTNIVRHYDASGKDCPKPMINDPSMWIRFRNEINNKNKIGVVYMFSWRYYLDKNKDVRDLIGNVDDKTKETKAYEHYVNYGKKEGRSPLPDISKFKEEEYLQLNQDVVPAIKNGTFVNGLDHYIQYGYKETHRKVCKDPTQEVKELQDKINKIKEIVK